jgi:hypothetical protein
MSVATELTRIQTAKADIKASIEAKGVTIPSDALIDEYADYVDEIQTGGGGGNEDLIDLIERDITSFNIPSGTTKIGNYAFYGCSGLTSVTIPDSVTNIGQYAFLYCSSLTSITISDNVTVIGEAAFRNCSGLTSIDIPDSVTSIGNGAFYGCNRLTSLVLNGGGVIGSGTSYGTQGAFQNCTGLSNVTISNSVTSLGINCFNSCSYRNFNSVVIPDSVTYIGMYCFSGCSYLNSITIGNGITNIDQQAFVNCARLTSLTINATTPPTLGANALIGTNANLIIYVPAASVDAYKAATNWSAYADKIQAIA